MLNNLQKLFLTGKKAEISFELPEKINDVL